MSREISELLALYDRRLSIARRERDFLKARQIKFSTDAETLFRTVIGPVFERLEAQIKDAGHQVWIRQSFSAAGGGAHNGNVEPSIVLDLRLVGAAVSGETDDQPIQSFGFRADLDEAVIINYSNVDAGRNVRAGSALGAVTMDQVTPQQVQRVFTVWFARLVDVAFP